MQNSANRSREPTIKCVTEAKWKHTQYLVQLMLHEAVKVSIHHTISLTWVMSSLEPPRCHLSICRLSLTCLFCVCAFLDLHYSCFFSAHLTLMQLFFFIWPIFSLVVCFLCYFALGFAFVHKCALFLNLYHGSLEDQLAFSDPVALSISADFMLFIITNSMFLSSHMH